MLLGEKAVMMQSFVASRVAGYTWAKRQTYQGASVLSIYPFTVLPLPIHCPSTALPLPIQCPSPRITGRDKI